MSSMARAFLFLALGNVCHCPQTLTFIHSHAVLTAQLTLPGLPHLPFHAAITCLSSLAFSHFGRFYVCSEVCITLPYSQV